ncbi:MAG: DUF1109 family protein [Alphaproteobacteria bacterium]|nr:DUF1109 family protein [Alphaproteobacteria bacterium]
MDTPTPPPALKSDREQPPEGALTEAQLAEMLSGLESARRGGGLERLRELPSGTRLALALAATALGPAALVLGSGLKPELVGLELEWVLALVVLLLSGFAATRVVRSLSQPPPVSPWSPALTLVAVAVVLVPASPEVLTGVSAQGMPAHLVCAAIGAAFIGLSLLATWALRRSQDLLRGASAGALAGGAALAALLLHCPFVDSAHQAIGHVLPLVLAVVLAALVAGRARA